MRGAIRVLLSLVIAASLSANGGCKAADDKRQPARRAESPPVQEQLDCVIKQTTTIIGVKPQLAPIIMILKQASIVSDEEDGARVSEDPKAVLKKSASVTKNNVTVTTTWTWQCQKQTCTNPCTSKVDIGKVKKKIKVGRPDEQEVEVVRGTLKCTCE